MKNIFKNSVFLSCVTTALLVLGCTDPGTSPGGGSNIKVAGSCTSEGNACDVVAMAFALFKDISEEYAKAVPEYLTGGGLKIEVLAESVDGLDSLRSGVKLDVTDTNGNPVSLTGYYGIDQLCVTYSAPKTLFVTLDLGEKINTLLKGGLPTATLEPRDTVGEYCVQWDEFKQPINFVKDPVERVAALQFWMWLEPGEKTSFNLDGVTLIAPLKDDVSSSSQKVEYSSSSRGDEAFVEEYLTIAEYNIPVHKECQNDTLGLVLGWEGCKDTNRVATGFDNGSDSSGYWYVTQESYKAFSAITWPTPRMNKLIVPASEVDACGGLCGRIDFEVDEESLIGLAFNVAGTLEDGESLDWADVTMQYSGICVTYLSSAKMSIELVPEESVAASLTYGAATMQPWPSRDTTVITRCIDFNTDDRKLAASRLQSIRLHFYEQSEPTAYFNILSVGFKKYSGGSSAQDSNSAQGSIGTIKQRRVNTLLIDEVEIPVYKQDGFKSFGDTVVIWQGTDYRISTGLDNGSDSSGYWFVVDEDFPLERQIYWPMRVPYNTNKIPNSVIDTCRGMCGAVDFEIDENDDLAVAFNVAGVDKSTGNVAWVDATEKYRGVCLTYYSDVNVNIDLVPEESVANQLAREAVSYKSWPAPEMIVTKCLKFDETEELKLAASRLETIRIRFTDAGLPQGAFNIQALSWLKK